MTDPHFQSLQSGEKLAQEIELLGHRLAQVRNSIARVIFGQQQVIEQTLTGLDLRYPVFSEARKHEIVEARELLQAEKD